MARTDPVIQATNILRTQIPKIRIIVQFLSGILRPPEGKLPRCGISVFLQCLNFCPTYRETPEPPGDGNSNYLSFFVICGLRLLRACLKAPALTGYVGDAQEMTLKKNHPEVSFRRQHVAVHAYKGTNSQVYCQAKCHAMGFAHVSEVQRYPQM